MIASLTQQQHQSTLVLEDPCLQKSFNSGMTHCGAHAECCRREASQVVRVGKGCRGGGMVGDVITGHWA